MAGLSPLLGQLIGSEQPSFPLFSVAVVQGECSSRSKQPASFYIGCRARPQSHPVLTITRISMTKHEVVLIPGDGIGPEVTNAVTRILQAAQAPVEWNDQLAGIAALDKTGEVLPDATVEAIKKHDVALKGPCTTPVGEGFTSVNVQLRKKLMLYAAVRPVRSLSGVPTRYDDVDLIILRENTEGLYSGVENQVTDDVVMSMKVATQTACNRMSKWSFRFATQRQREKITVFHKANIMKMSDGLFLRCAREVHQRDYPNIKFDEAIIDAGCMRIVQDPSQFDVLLLENLYGDVVSDLCAGLVGGLGVVPGANIGDERAVFEAVHGSAPDIAGKGVANPLALLMSSVMMLNYLAENRGDDTCREVADRIQAAYDGALAQGQKTADLGGELNTEQFADAIIERLG